MSNFKIVVGMSTALQYDQLSLIRHIWNFVKIASVVAKGLLSILSNTMLCIYAGAARYLPRGSHHAA